MRRRSGSAGALAGIVGAILIACGYAVLADVPGPAASPLEVYGFFLDHRSGTRIATALLLVGLTLLLAFVAVLRGRLDPARSDGAATTMLVAGALAIAATSFATAALGALAVGAEAADPAGSRAILDLSGAVAAAAGPPFAVMLAAASTLARDSSDARPVLVPLALAAAVGCALWLAPLVTDADALQAGSLLGTTLGLAGLIAWTAASAVWMLRADPG